MLKSKYVQAASFLAQQCKHDRGYQTEFSICVNACFAQQMSAYKGFKEFGERAVAAMMKELIQPDKGAVPGKLVVIGINPDRRNRRRKH